MSHRRSLLMKRPSAGGGWYDGGNALKFDGVDDFVVTNNAFVASTNQYTISLWFKPYQVSSFNPFASLTSINGQFAILNSTQIRLRGTTNANFTVPTMVANNWHHVLAVKDATSARLWLNAVESTSGSLSPGNVPFPIQRLGVNQASSFFYNGELDEIIMESDNSSYGLTDAQNLYNGGNGVDSSTIITNPDFYYKLNESGTTTTAADSSGNGYNGTLNNFPTSGMWVAH